MDVYKEWLKEEKKWIGKYRKRTFRKVCLKVVPITLGGMALLFGVMMALDGGGKEAFFEGAIGGIMIGLFPVLFYLLFFWFGLRPGNYAWLIQHNVEELGLTESEQELLGGEMLRAFQEPNSVIEFEMVGPKVNHTPARFVLTPHFAFLEGGSPYSILVRLSDIAWIQSGEEEKTAVKHGTKINTHYSFTLYNIGFYKKERQYFGASEEKLPDIAMGFFQKEIRNQVLEKLKSTEITIVNQKENSDRRLLGFLGKKDTLGVTEPANDTERWFTATYAIWSAWVWNDGDWRYFAGVKEITKEKENELHTMLSRDWGITDKETLFDTVEWLLSKAKDGIPEAWDLCRACQILGMSYVIGYIKRKELVNKSIEIGHIMQKYYHSWDELYESYMQGYRTWRKTQGGNVQKAIAQREAVYDQLWKQPDGPCSIKWNLELR